jgi:hypothetical protein
MLTIEYFGKTVPSLWRFHANFQHTNILSLLFSYSSMALRHGMRQKHLFESFLIHSFMQERYYASTINWKELKPMILKRVRSRAKDYPIRRMVPVAEETLRARETLIQGVSALLQVVPVKSCE